MSSSRHEPSRRAASQQPPSSTSLPSHPPPAVKAGTRGGGQALDRRTNAEMSAKFGHDFSSIRIHTDARAGETAAAIGANAYALGGDIVFGDGKYQPGSRETERLLAHELTHVVQQSQFGPGDWGRASAKGDASEREADNLASQVMMGRSVSVLAAPGAAVARDAAGTDVAASENGDGGTGLQGDGQFGLPPGVLASMGIESMPISNPQSSYDPGVESMSNTPGYPKGMGESIDAGPSEGPTTAASVSGTSVFDPVADSGLGQPFMAPSSSLLSGLF